MSTWTRAHDAHIARECEGWTLKERPGYVVNWPHYNTDPAAAIRAAEAWVEKAPDTRSIQYQYFGRAQKLVTAWDVERGRFIEQSATTAAAIAQALYRATGGPACGSNA